VLGARQSWVRARARQRRFVGGGSVVCGEMKNVMSCDVKAKATGRERRQEKQ
jgi:hypothetical protein